MYIHGIRMKRIGQCSICLSLKSYASTSNQKDKHDGSIIAVIVSYHHRRRLSSIMLTTLSHQTAGNIHYKHIQRMHVKIVKSRTSLNRNRAHTENYFGVLFSVADAVQMI